MVIEAGEDFLLGGDDTASGFTGRVLDLTSG
jgi:hypothetical protein